MNWEVFKFTGFRKHPKGITLNNKGVLYFSKTIFQMLGEPEHIEYLFDREARLIGLKKSDDTKANKVRCASGCYIVSARAFCNFFKIDYSKKRTLPFYVDGEVLVLQQL